MGTCALGGINISTYADLLMYFLAVLGETSV